MAETERALADAVCTAKDDGQSWTEIGVILGMTRQVTHERFGQPTRRSRSPADAR